MKGGESWIVYLYLWVVVDKMILEVGYEMELYNEFIKIVKIFNKELDIILLLYGFLGFEKVIGLDFFLEVLIF